MIIRWIALTTLLVLISHLSVADDVTPVKQSRKQIRRELARKQILQLKESTLLVRLHFNNKSVELMRQYGNDKKADKYSGRITKRNLEIVNAFKNHFSFCPVHFFASDQTQLILDGEFEKIAFLDSTLHPVINNIPVDSDYFIGEFHFTERDTAQYFSHYSSVHNESFKNERVKNYYGSMERGLYALIIRNSKFHQLSKPFPYNVKVYRKFRLHIPRSPEKVVIIMNRKLERFLKEQHPGYNKGN